ATLPTGASPATKTDDIPGLGFHRITSLGHINHYPLAMGNECLDIALGANIKTLDGERCLMPWAIKIRHKHADLKILNRYFLLTDSHHTPLHRAIYDNS